MIMISGRCGAGVDVNQATDARASALHQSRRGLRERVDTAASSVGSGRVKPVLLKQAVNAIAMTQHGLLIVGFTFAFEIAERLAIDKLKRH